MDRKPHQERSLVILKPDTVQRSLMGEVIKRFEQTGLKISAMKMFMATEEQLLKHYHKTDEWFLKKGNRIIEDLKTHGLPVEKEPIEYGKDIIRTIVRYMTAAPVVAMILEGNQAVAVVTKLVGTTEPATSDVGTIRGDFALDSYYLCDVDGSRGLRNLVHCTDVADGEGAAEREIGIWFTEEEIMKYRLVSEAMLYDVDLDGIME